MFVPFCWMAIIYHSGRIFILKKNYLRGNMYLIVSMIVCADYNAPTTLYYRQFTLSVAYPRRQFTNAEYVSTLRDLGLVPSAALLVLPVNPKYEPVVQTGSRIIINYLCLTAFRINFISRWWRIWNREMDFTNCELFGHPFYIYLLFTPKSPPFLWYFDNANRSTNKPTTNYGSYSTHSW